MLEVAQLRLDEMIKSQSAKEISIGEHIKQFAVGRGATDRFCRSLFFDVTAVKASEVDQ